MKTIGDFMRKREYCVFDVETTGIEAHSNNIIQFAASIMNENGDITQSLNLYIKQDRELPEFITNLTGITDELLNEKGVTEEEAYNIIFGFIGSRALVAHNAHFDVSFLKELKKKYGPNKNDYLPNPVFDTIAYSRILWPTKKHNLTDLTNRLGIKLENAHSADYDVVATVAVWKRFLDKM